MKVMPRAALTKLFNNYYHNHVDILRSFLLLPQDYLPLLGVAWTLIHELYFYLVVSFALMFAAGGRWVFGCLWFLIILTVYRCFGESGFGQIRILQLVFSPFSLTFLLGYFVGLLCHQIKKAPLALALALFVVGVGGMAFGLVIPWPHPVGVYPENNNLFRFVACGLPAAFSGRICHRLGITIAEGDFAARFPR